MPPNLVDTPATRGEYARYQAEITYFDGQVGEWQERVEAGDKIARQLIQNHFNRPAEELYNVLADPYCRKTLAANPELAKVLKEHSTQLDTWMKQQGDQGAQTELDAANRYTKLQKKTNGTTSKKKK